MCGEGREAAQSRRTCQQQRCSCVREQHEQLLPEQSRAGSTHPSAQHGCGFSCSSRMSDTSPYRSVSLP